MRKLLVLVLLSLPLSAAYVQSNKAVYSSPTTTPTVTITPTAGNLLVVGCIVASTGAAPTFTVSSTIGGSAANSWSRAVQGVAGYANSWSYETNIEMWYAPNVSAGATTITCGLTVSSYVTLIVAEYSGMATSTPLDGTNVGGGSGTAADSANITTTNANDLLVGVVVKTGSDSISAGTSFTIRQEEETDSAVSGAFEDRSVTSTGTYNASFTLGASTSWYVLAAAFRESVGGPPPSTRRRIMIIQ